MSRTGEDKKMSGGARKEVKWRMMLPENSKSTNLEEARAKL